jgi:hypothetical protein
VKKRKVRKKQNLAKQKQVSEASGRPDQDFGTENPFSEFAMLPDRDIRKNLGCG